MTKVKKLLSIGTEPVGAKMGRMPTFLETYALSVELFAMLEKKNGFYAFEQALHVFPLQSDITGAVTMEDWNSDTLWRSAYDGLTDGLLFFSEDAFGDQFCLAIGREGVFDFMPRRQRLSLSQTP